MADYGVENGRFQPELSAGPEGAADSRDTENVRQVHKKAPKIFGAFVKC